MLRGDFESAWRESDLISERAAPDPNRLWSGRPLTGKRVIIRCLHGLGDAIQFIRFVTPLRNEAAAIYVEGPGRLVRLFQTFPGVDRVITWDSPASGGVEWDEQIEVMELPRVFRTNLGTIPNRVPYLFPGLSPARAGCRETPAKAQFKVGIAWASSEWDLSKVCPPFRAVAGAGKEGDRFLCTANW